MMNVDEFVIETQKIEDKRIKMLEVVNAMCNKEKEKVIRASVVMSDYEVIFGWLDDLKNAPSYTRMSNEQRRMYNEIIELRWNRHLLNN